jgi:RimJ/RimL family protein N-acetyltransferase
MLRRVSLSSPRLLYRRLGEQPGDVGEFHRLVTDDHVRRYLLDGELKTRAFCEEEVHNSQKLFAERAVGLWLMAPREQPAQPIGFCGFRVFPEVEPEPELLYALLPAHTGQGFATEAGRALVRYAFEVARFQRISSAVDEPNVASIRVLEKVGFRRCGEQPGAFGRMLLFECERL